MDNGGNKTTFYTLLLTLPLFIVTNIVYPYPDDKKDKMSNLKNAFAMLDIIDMAELIFGDIGCFQTYEKGYIVVFYITLLASAVLTTFYSGLEQRPKDKDDGTEIDAIFTGLNLFFNDFLFLFLRAVTIHKESHAYFGVIFLTKEVLSLIIRSLMLYFRNEDD